MLALIALLQALLRQNDPPTRPDDLDDPQDLDRWLFDRDSRWQQ